MSFRSSSNSDLSRVSATSFLAENSPDKKPTVRIATLSLTFNPQGLKNVEHAFKNPLSSVDDADITEDYLACLESLGVLNERTSKTLVDDATLNQKKIVVHAFKSYMETKTKKILPFERDLMNAFCKVFISSPRILLRIPRAGLDAHCVAYIWQQNVLIVRYAPVKVLAEWDKEGLLQKISETAVLPARSVNYLGGNYISEGATKVWVQRKAFVTWLTLIGKSLVYITVKDWYTQAVKLACRWLVLLNSPAHPARTSTQLEMDFFDDKDDRILLVDALRKLLQVLVLSNSTLVLDVLQFQRNDARNEYLIIPRLISIVQDLNRSRNTFDVTCRHLFLQLLRETYRWQPIYSRALRKPTRITIRYQFQFIEGWINVLIELIRIREFPENVILIQNLRRQGLPELLRRCAKHRELEPFSKRLDELQSSIIESTPLVYLAHAMSS